MSLWVAKALTGLLLVLAIVIAILCWVTDSLLLVTGLSLLFIADCFVLNKYGELNIFEDEDNDQTGKNKFGEMVLRLDL